jgi:hypothetical protein
MVILQWQCDGKLINNGETVMAKLWQPPQRWRDCDRCETAKNFLTTARQQYKMWQRTSPRWHYCNGGVVAWWRGGVAKSNSSHSTSNSFLMATPQQQWYGKLLDNGKTVMAVRQQTPQQYWVASIQQQEQWQGNHICNGNDDRMTKAMAGQPHFYSGNDGRGRAAYLWQWG